MAVISNVYQTPEQLLEQIDQHLRDAGLVDITNHDWYYVFQSNPRGNDKLGKYCWKNRVNIKPYHNKGIVRFFLDTKEGLLKQKERAEALEKANETPEEKDILKEIRKIGQKDMGMK